MRQKKPRLVILVAVKREAEALAKTLGLKPTATPWEWVGGEMIRLYVVGIGAGHIPAGLREAEGVILAGLAGALETSLQVGEVVVDAASAPLPKLEGVRVGNIKSSECMVTTPAAKAELYKQTGALAVEMESATVRGAIGTQQAFVHIRAISDTAQEELDPAVLGYVDEMGQPRWKALAAGLIRRPNRMGYLLQLQRHCDRALARLGQELGKIVNSSWPRI